jgi:hypothetical protein
MNRDWMQPNQEAASHNNKTGKYVDSTIKYVKSKLHLCVQHVQKNCVTDVNNSERDQSSTAVKNSIVFMDTFSCAFIYIIKLHI